MAMLFRVAAVSFLNTRPLIHGLGDDASQVALTRALPSRLAGLLEAGEADVALLPVIETFRGRSGGILPGTGIACRGEVGSVKLFGVTPLDEVETILADRGSRASVALAEVLLRESTGGAPVFRETEPRPGQLPGEGEALLVIGDRCFEYERELRKMEQPGVWSRDLGQWWTEMTGLPFVFAVWAVASDFDPTRAADLARILTAARDRGLTSLDELAAEAAAEGRLGHGGEATAAAIVYYFRHNLLYRLGDEEELGMRRFHELCLRHGVIPEGSFPAVVRG